jgi:hypothetical protein
MANLDPDQVKMLEVQHVLSNSIETLWRCSTAVDEPSADRQSRMQTDLCVSGAHSFFPLSSPFISIVFDNMINLTAPN